MIHGAYTIVKSRHSSLLFTVSHVSTQYIPAYRVNNHRDVRVWFPESDRALLCAHRANTPDCRAAPFDIGGPIGAKAREKRR